ncbi:MAG: ROK family protein [Synergistaceae bacterium]|jgi:glucokinase|nr:ROK family protein [Synergistaceae bacterium]
MNAVGVDLGGHKVVAGFVENGAVRARVEESTEASREPGPVIAQIARMVHELGAGSQVPTGVCIPGGVDASRENALMITNFMGWNGLPIRRMLEEAIGGCTVIENDANAYALGEGFAGAARGMNDYVVLTLGTGIGGGIVSGGRLLTGAHGMAGELGHIVLGCEELCGPGCRGVGHFEAMCGADALERRAREMGLGHRAPERHPDLRDLWARRADPAVAPFWDFALSTIARGIASLVHVFDPELVIIGGGLRRGEGFMELLEARIPRYLGEPFRRTMQIRSSLLDTDAPIFGAAGLARARMERQTAGQMEQPGGERP